MAGPRDEKRSAVDTDRATRREAVSGGHGQGHATRSEAVRGRPGPGHARRSAADTDRATRRETVDGGHGTGRASECQNAFGQFRRCAKGKLPFVPTKTLVNTSLLSLPSVNHVSTPLAAGALNDY